MKANLNIALAASLAVGITAQPHNHQHQHQHARKHQHASPLDARDAALAYSWEVDTVYVDVDGSAISKTDAQAGLDDGTYKVVGETTPESTTPVPTSTSTPTPTPTPSSSSTVQASTSTSAASTSSAAGAQFLEVNNKVGSKSTSTTTSSAAAATTTKASSSSSSSGATGINADFPDGEFDCSDFDSVAKYGAVALDNTAVSPWAGYQHVGLDAYTIGQTASITVDISEPTSGDPAAGTFVGYACESGYDAAQWPAAQGSTGQSIGGLWCGSDKKLYLTRSETTSKLCQAGAGNVHIVSKLSKDVYICKTWYPGNEGMYLPTLVSAGETVDLYNPYQADSYEWLGATTSAQYYLNLQDLSVSQACTWTPDAPYSTSAGNWAGMNLGTSVNADGETFLSIFHNTPTSDASLDYNIQIAGTADGGEGEVNGLECTYDYSSNYVTGGGNGCTVSATGGDIYVILSD